MFRCCLPCRGGSAAPATSPPSSPSPTSDEQYTNLTVDEPLTTQSSSNIRLTPSQIQTQTQNNQQSPLPHIEEEEEAENNHRKSEEDLSVKDNFLLISSGVGAGASGSANSKSKLKERFIGEVSNSPSPRTKINRKQSKGRTRPITSTSDTTGGSGGGGILTGVINNVTSIIPAGLLPKMQAEQGSIGDLQKYHTRYLKNRRHTLANVR